MRNIYFIIAFISACHARAQYTLTASSNPVVGDVYQYCYMYATGVTGGSSGAAQVWDYSNLVAYPSGRVMQTYTTAASTLSASLFPSANMVSETDRSPGSFEYYHISATEKSLAGKILYNSNSSSGGSIIRYANPIIFSVLPFSYGSSPVSNTFTGSNTNSFGSLNYSGAMTIKAEGTGMLILPDGQIYYNVLKIETVETYTLNGSDTVATTTVNEWYSAASKFPLLHVLSFITGNGSGTFFVNTEVKMNTGVDVGLRESADTKAEFSIYPNPSQTEVFVGFETSSEKSYSLDIIDIQGSIVKQEAFSSVKNGMQHHRVDLSGLSAGTYFAKLYGNGKEGVRKLVIE